MSKKQNHFPQIANTDTISSSARNNWHKRTDLNAGKLKIGGRSTKSLEALESNGMNVLIIH